MKSAGQLSTSPDESFDRSEPPNESSLTNSDFCIQKPRAQIPSPFPRDGSLALAFFGRMRKAQKSPFSLSAGRNSFALKRIVVLAILLNNTNRVPAKQQLLPFI